MILGRQKRNSQRLKPKMISRDMKRKKKKADKRQNQTLLRRITQTRITQTERVKVSKQPYKSLPPKISQKKYLLKATVKSVKQIKCRPKTRLMKRLRPSWLTVAHKRTYSRLRLKPDKIRKIYRSSHKQKPLWVKCYRCR